MNELAQQKGYTPIQTKGRGSLGKSGNIHMPNTGYNHQMDEMDQPTVGKIRSTSRNGQKRIPSIPKSMKGSIGSQSPGQISQLNQQNT